jgi:pyrimidine-nucleoside phosphorylase
MSKKLAEGIDALVLDVKTGSGAFMKRQEDAATLARTMIGIGAEMGKKVVALITDMDQPLGNAVGNSLEVMEAVDMLRGCAPADYTEATLALTAEMLVLGKVAKDEQQARAQLQEAIRSGRAVKKLEEIVRWQHGDPAAVTDYARLPRARAVVDVAAPSDGVVTGIDSEAVGLAAMALGAGRERTDSVIDPGVGFLLRKKVGDRVRAGEPLVQVHYNDDGKLEEVKRRVLAAYRVGSAAPAPRPLVLQRLQ